MTIRPPRAKYVRYIGSVELTSGCRPGPIRTSIPGPSMSGTSVMRGPRGGFGWDLGVLRVAGPGVVEG
jgi:hypothetical protein